MEDARIQEARVHLEFARRHQRAARALLSSRQAFRQGIISVVSLHPEAPNLERIVEVAWTLDYVLTVLEHVPNDLVAWHVFSTVVRALDHTMTLKAVILAPSPAERRRLRRRLRRTFDELQADPRAGWAEFVANADAVLTSLERDAYQLAEVKPLANSSAAVIQRAFRAHKRAAAATTIQRHYRRSVVRRAMRDLVEHVMYAPGGPGYEAGRRRFEAAQGRRGDGGTPGGRKRKRK
jgi:hypothetical protein